MMEARLLVLKKVLDTLDVPAVIETVSDRIKVQKAIYLAKRAGVDLGYTYGWYRRGPYSPRLTRDYFDLRDAIAIEGDPDDNRRLVPSLERVLTKAKPLFTVPVEVPLRQDLWLELLASVAYLGEEQNQTTKEVDEVLRREKPRLAPYVENARAALAVSAAY